MKKELHAIDVKMCLALTSTLKTAGDIARKVRIEVGKLQRHRAKHSKIMSGREGIASNAEVMYQIDTLIHLEYPGDAKIFDFHDHWHAILGGIRAEDIPPQRTLRDILHKKVRDSTIMKFDLSLYDQLPDADYHKTSTS